MLGNVEILAMKLLRSGQMCEEQEGKSEGSVKENNGHQWEIVSQEQQPYAMGGGTLNMTCILDFYPKAFCHFVVDCEGTNVDQRIPWEALTLCEMANSADLD